MLLKIFFDPTGEARTRHRPVPMSFRVRWRLGHDRRQHVCAEEAGFMTTQTETTAREQIVAVLNDCAAAISAKDARRAVAHYAPDVVSFSLAPPLRGAGDEVTDPAGIDGWFRTWDGPIGYDIGDRVIEVGGDVAFCHGLTHLTGTKTDGAQVDLWFRSTVGLRRTAEGWQITHEHDSTPYYMDGSDRAATDLRP
jgi:ketosteroid isomerase-like protein